MTVVIVGEAEREFAESVAYYEAKRAAAKSQSMNLGKPTLLPSGARLQLEPAAEPRVESGSIGRRQMADDFEDKPSFHRG